MHRPNVDSVHKFEVIHNGYGMIYHILQYFIVLKRTFLIYIEYLCIKRS